MSIGRLQYRYYLRTNELGLRWPPAGRKPISAVRMSSPAWRNNQERSRTAPVP
jgi:hypothetical protein